MKKAMHTKSNTKDSKDEYLVQDIYIFLVPFGLVSVLF